MLTTSFEELCSRFSSGSSTDLSALLPEGIQQEVGHFNVFNLTEITQGPHEKSAVSCASRAFYKISFLTGRSVAEFHDRKVEILRPTLVFSTPKSPFYWLPIGHQTGQFCVFTAEFLHPSRSGVVLDELPIFKSPEHPVYSLSDADITRVQGIFENMEAEIASNYAYKYDLLRAYALELIHIGQKLQSSTILHPNHSASARTTSLFLELLERQFPLESPQQKLTIRTAKQYADQLAVHINHLNKVLKETTGLTTTELIAGRILQEAKALLRHTGWSIAEIADSLGFSDFAHFAKFFKNETSFSPGVFRRQTKSLNYT
ncbi:helix-turn-helix domain-containing protein [Dyadobacter subterraneus]|uniref:Helix-turn-helix transcriptional regulator n=1 Tax=Dyadobacter subterraneus TaxID=2773304 RepID=A0ABR9WB03_9BACT|nr:helix-turn-helix transcriptional regulator [Dyadobacter subterraneus]MBE9462653.1 helix-turn-helix transcriptional regulator [Dyadobacter subterraneus]